MVASAQQQLDTRAIELAAGTSARQSAHEEACEKRQKRIEEALSDITRKLDKNSSDRKVDLAELTGKVEDLNALKPNIEAGIKADQQTAYRRRTIKWAFAAVVGTMTFLVTVVLPLVQWLGQFHITIAPGKP